MDLTTSNQEESDQISNLTLYRLAVCQLIFGCVGIAVGAVEVSLFSDVNSHGAISYGQGIWCSVWVVAAACLGIVASRNVSDRLYLTLALSFNIVATVFMLIWLTLQILFGPLAYTYSVIVVNMLLSIAMAYGYKQFM